MLPPLEPTPLEVVTPKHPAFEFVVPESITIELMVAIEDAPLSIRKCELDETVTDDGAVLILTGNGTTGRVEVVDA